MAIPAMGGVVKDASAQLQPLHLLVLGGLIVGGFVLAMNGARQSSGGIKVPAAQVEDAPALTIPPSQPVIGADEHRNGYVYLPHRYPRVTGQEITALINGGHATLKLPRDGETLWITCPPSEVTL